MFANPSRGVLTHGRSRLSRVGLPGMLLFAGMSQAAVDPHSNAFSFVHTGEVATPLISVLGYFSNPTIVSSPAVALPQFDPSLGRLTKATVVVTTSTATFVVSPQGVLSLISGASITRNLRYTVTAGATTGTGANEVTTTGGSLLTLLGLGSATLGGAPLANTSEFTSLVDLGRFTGAGTVSVGLTATDTLSIFTLVSVADGAGLKGTGTYAGTATVNYEYTPWTLAGTVYKDADHDGFRSAGEAATGLTLYAKLLSAAGGPVVQTTPVDPVTGFYAFAAPGGNYRIVIDDNASASDVTALQPPAGWTATQSASLWRDVSVTGNLANQDFGLVQATGIAGIVFKDVGSGGGTANDGVRNGSEPGAGGQTVQLLDAGGAVLDSTVTTPDGAFRLFVPAAVANASTLRTRLLDDGVLLATGAAAGTTGGTYDRSGRSLSFVFSNASAYAGIALGGVPVPTLSGTRMQAGVPGAVLFYAHRFVANTAGKVSFSTSHGLPPDVRWSEAVYLDANGNGQLDAGESPVSGAIDVVAGQILAVILKIAVPEAAAGNQRLETVLKADLVLTNAAPPLTVATGVTDYSVVLPLGGASLVLSKSVNVPTAAPGATLVYTIQFTNRGTNTLKNLVLTDVTPAYTTYLSAATLTMPAALSAAALVAPSVGASGAVQWTFGGELAPGAAGSVQFSVLLNP